MKPVDARINYYTKKVAEYGAVHYTKRRNPYRYDRLMNYKEMMHQQVEENDRELDKAAAIRRDYF